MDVFYMLLIFSRLTGVNKSNKTDFFSKKIDLFIKITRSTKNVVKGFNYESEAII